MRRPVAGLLAGLVMLPLAACRATVRVDLSVARSGGGTVAVSAVLDREAAASVGNITFAVDIHDLQQQGWRLSGPVTGVDGSVSITVTHDFAKPADARKLLARLSPLIRLDVTHHRGWVSSSTVVHGTVDLHGGVDALAPGTAASLAAVARAGGAVPELAAQIVVHLPARPDAVEGGGRVARHTVTWDVPVGAQAAIGASVSQTDSGAEWWLGAAAVLLVALVVVLLVQAGVAARRRVAVRGTL